MFWMSLPLVVCVTCRPDYAAHRGLWLWAWLLPAWWFMCQAAAAYSPHMQPAAAPLAPSPQPAEAGAFLHALSALAHRCRPAGQLVMRTSMLPLLW